MSGRPTSPFEMLGGETAVRGLVDRFYDLMDSEPVARGIRALHPESLAESRDKLTAFLTGWLGGPPVYHERYGPPMMRARHLPFPIGNPERDAWLACMEQALDEREMPDELRDFLRDRFRAMADHMRNVQPGAP